jgi:hypothetical protein
LEEISPLVKTGVYPVKVIVDARDLRRCWTHTGVTLHLHHQAPTGIACIRNEYCQHEELEVLRSILRGEKTDCRVTDF